MKNIPFEYDSSKMNPNFQLPKLCEHLVDKSFEIQGISFFQGNFGEYAVVMVEAKQYITGSKVLLNQLHDIDDLMQKHKDTALVTLRKIKRYYTF